MVHFEHATPTRTTVVRARRLDRVTFLLLADSSHLVLNLTHLFVR